MLQERKSREKYMANVKLQLDELQGKIRLRRGTCTVFSEKHPSAMPPEHLPESGLAACCNPSQTTQQ